MCVGFYVQQGLCLLTLFFYYYRAHFIKSIFMKCLQLFAYFIMICGSVNCKTFVTAPEPQTNLLLPLTVRMEVHTSQKLIDAVINLCHSVQPTTSIQIQSFEEGTVEVKVIFDRISVSNRQLLVDQIQEMKQVRIMEMFY